MQKAEWTRRQWMESVGLGAISWAATNGISGASGAEQTDTSFGRRLEPPGRSVIHGAGQSNDAFATYCEALGPDLKPMIFMTYVGLRRSPRGGMEWYFKRLAQQLEKYADNFLIPQIGLSLTKDGSPEQRYEHRVAAGDYDTEINDLCEGLRQLDRPAFVRIGYEFNGNWNGYLPDSYRAAWRRIVEAFRDRGLDEVAAVWCYAPGGKTNYMDFYPGDDHVDWWSIDLFSASHFKHSVTEKFMAVARQHKFPVMIGESTPRRVGVLDGEASWSRWFAPYFEFIRRHDHVKALCYISWDWGRYPKWQNWGDARIEVNGDVLARWKRELGSDLYIHGGSSPVVRKSLDLT